VALSIKGAAEQAPLYGKTPDVALSIKAAAEQAPLYVALCA
jgi:hypothetical protein